MFIYLVAIVVIICSIFGLTYSQTSLGDVTNEGAQLSTIQLPAFMHSTPVIQHPQAGVDGDNGIAETTSQQSLEISSEGMEEENRAEGSDEDRPKDDRWQLERRIFNQKLKDANQLGLPESLWSPALQNHANKDVKETKNENYASDGSKPAAQKINTNTIFNMIQYETFKEAMAVLQKQQEEEEAAKAAETVKHLEKTTEKYRNERILSNEEEKENLPVHKNAN